MSDLLYSSNPQPSDRLAGCLEEYLEAVSAGYSAYQGTWGALALARSPHDENLVVEDERFLSVLIGTPLIRISPKKEGLRAEVSGREALHELLKSRPDAQWDRYLDGPFAILAIDKEKEEGRVITDLMAFIPVFSASLEASSEANLVLGTHVDAVAEAAQRRDDLDEVSAADFLAHSSITFPHTIYREVAQVKPGAITHFDTHRGAITREERYWHPLKKENRAYNSFREAALLLRRAFKSNVEAACHGHDRVGLLFSGGEDARAVLGAVPENIAREPFVLADWKNREVQTARKAARAYDVDITFGKRPPDHYLRWMEQTATAIGSQHHFIHVHTYKFHERLGISDLPLVLGGYTSDTFLKGCYAPRKTYSIPKIGTVWISPAPEPPLQAPDVAFVRNDLLQEVKERRRKHLQRIERFGLHSPSEWMQIWPFSMRTTMGLFGGNRRLFKVHEPFMSTPVVKLAASVPLKWKLRRRLFQHAMRPFLAKSWYVPHAAENRLPYFGFFANIFFSKLIEKKRYYSADPERNHLWQGPWTLRKDIVTSNVMQEKLCQHLTSDSPLWSILESEPDVKAFVKRARSDWGPRQQLQFLQLAFFF